MNVLKVGEAEKSLGACHANMYAHMIEDADALDKIEDLQNHDDDMIYQMATFLLETFWVEEDDVMQWRMQDWRQGGAETIEMLICVKI